LRITKFDKTEQKLNLFFQLFGEEVVKTEPTPLFIATRSHRVAQVAFAPEKKNEYQLV